MADPESRDLIATFRAAKGLTLEAFGAIFGVHKTTVMRWEEGHVPAERAVEIERKTGIPRHELRPDLYPQSERAQDIR